MIFNLVRYRQYIGVILKFLSILFKRGRLVFIATNIVGILSKIMTIVAFFFSVKVVSLIYQETLLSVLNSFEIEWVQGLTLQATTFVVAALAFLMFLMSGVLPFLYVKVIRNYTYENALVFRRKKTQKFLEKFSSVPDNEKRKTLRLYLFNKDQKYTRDIINIIKYLFEMIQTFVVLCVCIAFLVNMYPVNGLYFLFLLLVSIMFFVKINWKLTKLKQKNELMYFNNIKKRKTDLLDHEGIKLVSPAFTDLLSSGHGSKIEKKYIFSTTSNDLEVRKIQLILQIVLGLFFTYIILMLALSESNLLDFTKLIISFFLLRFMFGIIQNFVSSIKNVNREYSVLTE